MRNYLYVLKIQMHRIILVVILMLKNVLKHQWQVFFG